MFEQLALVGDDNQKALCREKVENIEPSLRYVTYMLSRSETGAAAIPTAMTLNTEMDQILKSKIEVSLFVFFCLCVRRRSLHH